MLAEINVLRGLLIAAFAIAPRVSIRFLLGEVKLLNVLHGIAFALVVVSIVFDVPYLSVAWLLFCLLGLGFFVRQNLRRPSLLQVVQAVPFIFSIAGAVWLVAGANDLGLLGYDPSFSFYAALHGTVLGWLMVGCMAALATHASRFNRVYSIAVLGCLVSFFLIAFGIDGAPIIKPIGVVGTTLMVGLSLSLLLWECRSSKAAASFALVSLLGFLFTIFLAWRNELGLTTIGFAPFGVRPMVSLHGAANGLVVAPSMWLALHFRFPAGRRNQTASLGVEGVHETVPSYRAGFHARRSDL